MSFRREAHVPKGGPDGGDGGHGGDVVLVCDDSYRDLEHFRRASHFAATRGGHGQGAQRHGADGATLEIPVPPGTEILVERDGTRHDLVRAGQRATVARGGSGGRGNRHFVAATHQSPRFAERGLSGEETWLELRLKLLADVGLIGLPNAGKSSLLRSLTRATPKVADYPFTTLEPALGTLHQADRQLVIADIPGLIQGAADGVGLGHDFLAHVERTRLLVHVLDLAPVDGSDPERSFATVERELERYQPALTRLPRILALSKADLVSAPAADAARERWQARLGVDTPVIVTSAATHAGLDTLARELLRRVPLAPATSPPTIRQPGAGPLAGAPQRQPDPGAALPEHRVFRPAARGGFRVRALPGGGFDVDGEAVRRLLERFDLDNGDALAQLERRLRTLGVVRALKDAGFQPGDDVRIAGIAFDLDA